MTVLPTLWPVVGVIVATGVVTYALVQVWDRLIQRDEAEAERLLADHEESERLRRDEARRAGESKVILVKEVNHRTKNLLAVVTAILRLSRNDDPEAFMTGVLSRVNSLARTHTMLAENGWDDTHLSKLVDGELAQFLRPTSSERIILMAGEDLPLNHTAVQPIALVLHELVLNARLYGALSAKEGRVYLRWFESAEFLHIVWREQGGPSIAFPPKQRGFGIKVIDATIKQQLGGRIEREWTREGLICQIRLPVNRLGDHEPDRRAA